MKLLAKLAVSAAFATQVFSTQAVAGTYDTRCTTKSVPYQATVKGGQPEKVIGGAVIGGVIGKVITDNNGGAAAGALIGGAIGHENSRRTVTKYKTVETCQKVYIPARVTDQAELERTLIDLNAGRSVSREMIKDVQYTIGVSHDGKWGPRSRGAAEEYLASLNTVPEPVTSLYSLIVNDVVIVSSQDPSAIEEIQQALAEAGVESQIFVDWENT
ncbi:hypothetical protein [Cognatishimia activa]|uniref:17 kDa surface antigen n=1 Tax=Cognatishimia activa TaxID=1715691 RepID=A0A0P1IS88_9RHOB|nr:hypothetical protein [Cognatishimia activa]CUI62383.1 hypothetical protein TA5113_00966 [Cognatishimia activa]CUK26329.1 hypothetical protein TA5114_02138 [Cognatishimia activa]